MSDTELRQLIVYVGTLEKVNAARQAGTITENDFVVVTDAPEFALQSTVQAIQILIPNDATVSNILASQAFVNSSINNMAAFYDTADAQGNPFATKAALVAGPWYNKGELRTPTTNDYAIVSADETHNNKTSRFMYDGVQWVWQYTINDTQFTQAQIDALNSTATESKILQIATNTTAIGTLSSLQTSAKTDLVSAVNELQTGKQATINDLSDIRDNASAGKAASETIANYGNIVTHSVNEFATAAQGTKADSATQDVQMNGTSITTSGVANIPVMTRTTLGVAKVNTAAGTDVQSDGSISIARATDSDLASKTNNYRPLVSSQIDEVVKSGVVSNANTLTAQEKSDACTWLGAVTTDTAQDITQTKTFKAQQRIQSGQADGCLIIGADVAATTLTNGTRKLGRMGFPTNEDSTLNCAFVSCDTQGDSGSGGSIENCVDFGGRTGDITSTSPDTLNFTVAKTHNTTTNTQKQRVLQMTKNAANFTVQPQYNGTNLATSTDIANMVTTDTAQTITAKKTFQTTTWNGGLTAKRSGALGSYILFSNTNGDLGVIGVHHNEIPCFIDKDNTEPRAFVRAGIYSTTTGSDASVGDALTPVYINSVGIATACNMSGYALNANAVTVSNNDTITLTNNTCFRGGTLSAFTISVPVTFEYPYYCECDFLSGSTATTITYSGGGSIVWSADSDDLVGGVFVPVANTQYTLMFWYNGTSLCGISRAI